MITGDPKRTPTVIDFGNTDFYLSSGNATCGKSCFGEDPTEAWNHGDVGSQINNTWLGMVGPGVAHLGVDNSVWSDHTNIQPTMMALLRLRDDYTPDGRVLGEVIAPSALPSGMQAHRAALTALGQLYTQLEAPVGAFGLDTLRASTKALSSNSAGDATYTRIENQLQALGAQRDTIAGQIHALLLGAAFDGKTLNVAKARVLTRQGDRVLGARLTPAGCIGSGALPRNPMPSAPRAWSHVALRRRPEGTPPADASPRQPGLPRPEAALSGLALQAAAAALQQHVGDQGWIIGHRHVPTAAQRQEPRVRQARLGHQDLALR
jgi:hypothetical protein